MPRLTDTEKQDIIRHLEAGKPLPEKYRFLLFGDKREVELVWNGKTNEVCNVVLPFQTIEHVDEPRAEKVKEQPSLFNMDERGRQLTGWTNKLIWGDNKLILSSLKNGPLREEIEAQGGIKLIYIDPPPGATPCKNARDLMPRWCASWGSRNAGLASRRRFARRLRGRIACRGASK